MGAKNLVLSFDVGATGIKAGLVNLKKGQLVGEKYKVGTPHPATPKAIGKEIKNILKIFKWKSGKVSCGFPSVVKDGVCKTAANIDPSWVNTDAEKVLEKITGVPFQVINDADAAGIAELTYGNALNVSGTVILLTLGTGIGSAVFIDGKLVPNTELGHIEFKGDIAENAVSNRARKDRMLDYEDWAKELNEYLWYLHKILSPNLMILGGGISKRWDLFSHVFSPDLPVTNAKLYNDAGIVGAAVYTHPEFLPDDLKVKVLSALADS
jgi:polyphosphate glucokinase